MKKILLGVSGSIAAYKSASLVQSLKKDFDVQVAMTKSAQEFITPLTLKVLSQNPVLINLFKEENVDHVNVVKESEVVLVAPATANIISKMASGIGDDFLSTTLLVAHPSKVILAPAMNTKMYENPIIQKNLQTLKGLGVRIIEPKTSVLACGDYGQGAMANVNDIVDYMKEELK